jgi:hypothetical protein
MTMAIARGHPGHVDTPGIYRLGGRDLARDTGDDGRLAHLAPLVVRLEPVPAPLPVGFGGLLGIDDEEAAALGQLVHARAGREIFGVLGAAVEHDQQRQRLSRRPARNIQPVRARPSAIRERPGDELSRQSDLGLRRTRSHPQGIGLDHR